MVASSTQYVGKAANTQKPQTQLRQMRDCEISNCSKHQTPSTQRTTTRDLPLVKRNPLHHLPPLDHRSRPPNIRNIQPNTHLPSPTKQPLPRLPLPIRNASRPTKSRRSPSPKRNRSIFTPKMGIQTKNLLPPRSRTPRHFDLLSRRPTPDRHEAQPQLLGQACRAS